MLVPKSMTRESLAFAPNLGLTTSEFGRPFGFSAGFPFAWPRTLRFCPWAFLCPHYFLFFSCILGSCGSLFAVKAFGDALDTFSLAVSTTEAALAASAWLVLTIVPATFPTLRAMLLIKSFFRAADFFRFIESLCELLLRLSAGLDLHPEGGQSGALCGKSPVADGIPVGFLADVDCDCNLRSTFG